MGLFGFGRKKEATDNIRKDTDDAGSTEDVYVDMEKVRAIREAQKKEPTIRYYDQVKECEKYGYEEYMTPESLKEFYETDERVKLLSETYRKERYDIDIATEMDCLPTVSFQKHVFKGDIKGGLKERTKFIEDVLDSKGSEKFYAVNQVSVRSDFKDGDIYKFFDGTEIKCHFIAEAKDDGKTKIIAFHEHPKHATLSPRSDIALTVNEKTLELIIQDKTGQTEQMVVAFYDAEKNVFSSLMLYQTKDDYINHKGIDISFQQDYDGIAQSRVEAAEYVYEKLGYRKRAYKPEEGAVDSPRKRLAYALHKDPDQKDEHGRYLPVLDTWALNWLITHFMMPQVEFENRDWEAYKRWMETQERLKKEYDEDFKRRNPKFKVSAEPWKHSMPPELIKEAELQVEAGNLLAEWYMTIDEEIGKRIDEQKKTIKEIGKLPAAPLDMTDRETRKPL